MAVHTRPKMKKEKLDGSEVSDEDDSVDEGGRDEMGNLGLIE
jgi:hypothetical protein